ncbi:MAG: type VI secretion system baseplate subunit TssK [Gemmatimonadota bacterium]
MQKVLWTKGVLLSPQHLQAQDRFLEDLVGFQLSALTFCPWGFARLELDREALAGGSLLLSAAAGIFPDGLAFEMPDADAVPPPKPLEAHWLPDQESMLVHLGIPEMRTGGHNVSVSRGDRDTRYLSEVAMRRDENTGRGEKPVQLARKNFRLLAKGESTEGYSLLPVARVSRVAAGGFQLDPRFVPPLIDLAASEYLLTVARRLVEVLTARSSALSGARRQRNQSLADFGVTDVASFWLLYTLNTHLPRFRHLFEVRRGHPGELFGAMAALAGALTTFSTTTHPREIPLYDHADLSGCFTRLDAMLRDLLETVVPESAVTLPLRLAPPSVHATAIDHDRYLAAPEWYLAVKTGGRQDELVRRAPQLFKVSSADQIERLIKRALGGVGLRHVPTPPGAVPVKLGREYFALDRSGPDWDAIRMARNLAVYVPSDFPDAELELVVVLPPSGG